MEIRTLLPATVFGILLLGCESSPEKSPLTENPWEVVTIEGKAVIQTSKPLTTEFLAEGKLNGYDGVNWFHAGYEIHGKRIALQDKIESTLRGSLDPAINEQAGGYLHAIRRTSTYFIGDGDQLLHLCDANGKELATLKKIPR